MEKTITCPSCSAVYEDHLPKCPYCGTLNIKGAEAEYFEKLENIREDMEELETVPIQEAKKEVIRQSVFLKRILLAVGGIVMIAALITLFVNREEKIDAKAEYLWKQETFPILNALYEEKKFEELNKEFWEFAVDDMPVWSWEHADFCDLLDQSYYFEEILDKEILGEKLTEFDFTHLLYYGFRMTERLEDELSEDELENLAPYLSMVKEDFMCRWEFSEKDLEAIAKEREKNYGIVSFAFCEDYIKKWMKQRK